MSEAYIETGVRRMVTLPRRLAFGAAGLVCVGLAALGVFVPGLPTTIFLIAASYLFTRSCPFLERKLIRNRFFAPFLRYADRPSSMPIRARITALVMMWTFVTISTVILALRPDLALWIVAAPPGAALLGTWFILRVGSGSA